MMEKMINTMMKRYQLFAWFGFIIVTIAFLVSFSAADANQTFFSVDKATREAATSGSLVAANVTRNVLPAWVPSFKFLGLGVLLGAITMALGMIIQTLRELGRHVTGIWPEHLNPGVPEKPLAAKMFPMLMMMGWIVLIIGAVWSYSFADGIVAAYWSHSIAGELNPAAAGSVLLNQLGLITGTLPWFGVLRFLGMALLFTGITVALTVVIRTLQFQERVLTRFVRSQSRASV